MATCSFFFSCGFYFYSLNRANELLGVVIAKTLFTDYFDPVLGKEFSQFLLDKHPNLYEVYKFFEYYEIYDSLDDSEKVGVFGSFRSFFNVLRWLMIARFC